MSKMEHTPGPWRLHQVEEFAVVSEDGISLARTDAKSRPARRYIPSARRIVACVNACEGIADPEETVPDMLAALEELMLMLQGFDDAEPNWVETMNAARAAIAKARGTDAL